MLAYYYRRVAGSDILLLVQYGPQAGAVEFTAEADYTMLVTIDETKEGACKFVDRCADEHEDPIREVDVSQEPFSNGEIHLIEQ